METSNCRRWGGVTILSEQDSDDDLTAFGIPYVVPGLRLAYWTQSPVVVDGGISVLSLTFEDDRATVINVEGGASVNFGSEQSNIVPFVGGVAGLLSFSTEDGDDSESGFYLGGQGGVKVFFREYAAFRAQLAYRTMLDDELDINALEFAAGLSFFL